MRAEVTLTITPDSFVAVLFWCAFGTVMAVRFAPDWLLPLLPFVYFAWFIRRAMRDVKEQERQARFEAERLEKERLERRAASFTRTQA
jgi:hypothetical protein